MESIPRSRVVTAVLAACLVSAAVAETKKEFRYVVGPNTVVSVDTQYGGISVKPGEDNEVLVVATLQSDKAEVDDRQIGDRIDIVSHLFAGSDQQSGRIDYEVRIPANATLSLRSSLGPLVIERLRGDVSVEGMDATVDIHDVANGHVHVNTMRGPVTLTNVSNGHIEIGTITGSVTMKSVTGTLVKASSGGGKISYEGDFGGGGDYKFTTHSGNILAVVPAGTSADYSAHSMLGKVQHDFPLEPRHSQLTTFQPGSAFFGTSGKAASSVVLRSFSGRIRLKQQH
jgi:DUF4097 and DUF4098 domain-containing protein YvlB